MSATSTEFQAVVIGASGGIGAALVEQLAARDDVTSILQTSRTALLPARPKCTSCLLDLLDESSIAAVANACTAPRLVIVATGLLHGEGIAPEKSWRALSAEAMARSYAINTIGPALVAKYFLPLLPRTDKSVFAVLSARVGSISDNRTGGWHSYRAAKAALNQLVRTFSLELAMKNKNALCVGLHPGTVATHLSAPFQANVAADKLFTPATSATHLLRVIDGLTPAHSGSVFAWDGTEILA
jgi:NAD(P)-dependent dehydrogenase (short-subunit alcohol dehydrogenase family)